MRVQGVGRSRIRGSGQRWGRLSPTLQRTGAQAKHLTGSFIGQSLCFGCGHQVEDHWLGLRRERLSRFRVRDFARSFFSSKVNDTLSSASAAVFSCNSCLSCNTRSGVTLPGRRPWRPCALSAASAALSTGLARSDAGHQGGWTS